MIKVRLNELVNERGKTLYWLAKKTRVRYATVWQMARQESVRLNLKDLDKICTALDVTPGDVLVQSHKRRQK